MLASPRKLYRSAAALSSAARERVAEQFSVERTAQAHLKLFENLLVGNAHAPS